MNVTVEYLEDWEHENEEDVFFDGPFSFNEGQWEVLGLEVYQRLNEEFNTSHIWREFWEDGLLDDLWDLSDDRCRQVCLEAMVDVINKYNVREF